MKKLALCELYAWEVLKGFQMREAPKYLPLTIPYRGLDILVYVRNEDQMQGSAGIMKDGFVLMTIDPTVVNDFETGRAEMTQRAQAWIDQHLDAVPAN